MATESNYERSLSPAGFVTSRHQTLDLRPGMSLSKNSLLRSPSTIDMGNRPLGQNDDSQYDDDRAATDKVYRSRAGGDRYSMESRFSVEYLEHLENGPPHELQVLMDTIVNDLDTRAKGIEEQFKRQQNWNKDIQWGIDLIAEGLPRLQTLEDTITALEAEINLLIESEVWEGIGVQAK